MYPNLSGPKGTANVRTIDGGHEIDFTNYEEATIKLYLDLIHDLKPITETFLKIELGKLLNLIRFLVELGAIEESEFETKLLGYSLKLLSDVKMDPDNRYKTALALCDLKLNQVKEFIPKFLTKMNHQEYSMSCMNAMNDLAQTEAYLRTQIGTQGITGTFRTYILFKNKEVILIFKNLKKINFIDFSSTNNSLNKELF